MELSCRARLRSDSPANLAESLNRLAAQASDPAIAAQASFEAGRLLWKLEKPKAALDAFATAFQSTTN